MELGRSDAKEGKKSQNARIAANGMMHFAAARWRERDRDSFATLYS